MFRYLLAVLFLCFCTVAAAQYEGQVVVTYDGPSEFAPTPQQQAWAASQPVYTGGSSGGTYTGGSSGGSMRMYSGGSSGGAAMYSGGSSGGTAMYSSPVTYYQQPVYSQPVRYYSAPAYGGWGGGFGMGFNAGFGGGYQPRMVCGPNGCHYQ